MSGMASECHSGVDASPVGEIWLSLAQSARLPYRHHAVLPTLAMLQIPPSLDVSDCLLVHTKTCLVELLKVPSMGSSCV